MIRNLIKIVLLIQRQKKYNQLLIPNFVQKHYAVFNQKLSPKVYKKITDYYCIDSADLETLEYDQNHKP